MSTRHKQVEIPVDGQRIDGTLVAASNAAPGVLLVHGWDGSQEQYKARAHEIAALGIVESEHDKTVPHPVIESYLGAFKHVKSVTYRCIAGADHALSDERSRQAYGMLLVSWMTEMTLGGRAASGLLRPAPSSPA